MGRSSVIVEAAASNTLGTVYHGGSWRFVADLADLGSAAHLVGPRQSGHLKSNHLSTSWRPGETVCIIKQG